MRISEIYRSVQGEGPRVGLCTTFVRFAGCNLKCPGWACDTQHAIDPKLYRHEWKTMTVDALVDQVIDRSAPGENICLTGGEPFLQPHNELKDLVNILSVSDRKLECFSNGTLRIPEWAFADINFVLDWKLSGSGETTFNAETFIANLHTAFVSGPERHALKFTVADWDDFAEAFERWNRLDDDCELPVYVGPVWGRLEPSELVSWILQEDLDWRLTLQSHKYIWPADERRR